MYLVDLSSRKTLLLRKWGQDEMYFWVYSWSPDGNNLTYLTSTEWRVRSAEGDVALSSLGRGLGYDFRHNVDSYMVGFSADGLYVAVDQSNTAGAVFKVVRLTDKKVVYSRSDGTMATWAGYGANLYFRTDAGLETWDPVNAARLIIPGLGWTNPVPSADGARIAYLTADANGHHYAHQVRLSDQPMQPIVLSTLPRTGVAFLNPALVWYAEEAACNQTPCRCDDAICEPFLTGRSYVHDLLTGTINSSVVTDVQDSWPRLGST
jgi:Tol biopolymer transport system component